MREDMYRVIVERPRRKPWGARRKGRRPELEDLPKHEGMRRSHAERGECKELNENLAPLRRYLERQVGRPWNKVYSEIAAGLRVDNTVQQHVRDHLRDFVAIKPRRTGGWRSWLNGLWWQPLYVDPCTGLLCRTDRLREEEARHNRERGRRPAPVERIRLADGLELRSIDGIWYAVELAPLPDPIYRAVHEVRKVPLRRLGRGGRVVELELIIRRLVTPAVLDVVTGERINPGPETNDPESWAAYRLARPERRYAVSKRTLSRKELRQHGLSNAAAVVTNDEQHHSTGHDHEDGIRTPRSSPW